MGLHSWRPCLQPKHLCNFSSHRCANAWLLCGVTSIIGGLQKPQHFLDIHWPLDQTMSWWQFLTRTYISKKKTKTKTKKGTRKWILNLLFMFWWMFSFQIYPKQCFPFFPLVFFPLFFVCLFCFVLFFLTDL